VEVITKEIMWVEWGYDQNTVKLFMKFDSTLTFPFFGFAAFTVGKSTCVRSALSTLSAPILHKAWRIMSDNLDSSIVRSSLVVAAAADELLIVVLVARSSS
jgi:hypothetical protein